MQISREITNTSNDRGIPAGASVATALQRFRLKVKGSYKVLNCCLRHRKNKTLGIGQNEGQFVDRNIVGMLLCTEQRWSLWLKLEAGCSPLHLLKGQLLWKAETSRTPEEDEECKGDKCMDTLHFTCLYGTDTNTVRCN